MGCGSNDRWGRGSFFFVVVCLMGLGECRWCFPAVVFLNGSGLLGCLSGLGGAVVGCVVG